MKRPALWIILVFEYVIIALVGIQVGLWVNDNDVAHLLAAGILMLIAGVSAWLGYVTDDRR